MGIDLDALANELRAAGYVVCPDSGGIRVGRIDEQDGQEEKLCWVEPDVGVLWLDEWTPMDFSLTAIIARHLGAGPVASDRAALVERMAEAAWDANDRAGRRFARAFPDQRSTYLRSSDAALAAVESAGWGLLPMPIRAILDAPEFTAEEERAMQDLSGPRAEPVAGTGTHAICPGPRLQHDCEKGIVTSYDAHGNVFSRAGCTRCWGSGFAPVAPPEPLSAGELSAVECAAHRALREFAIGRELANDDEYYALRKRAVTIAVLAALPPRFPVPVKGT